MLTIYLENRGDYILYSFENSMNDPNKNKYNYEKFEYEYTFSYKSLYPYDYTLYISYNQKTFFTSGIDSLLFQYNDKENAINFNDSTFQVRKKDFSLTHFLPKYTYNGSIARYLKSEDYKFCTQIDDGETYATDKNNTFWSDKTEVKTRSLLFKSRRQNGKNEL